MDNVELTDEDDIWDEEVKVDETDNSEAGKKISDEDILKELFD